jgi:hypothetical protein
MPVTPVAPVAKPTVKAAAKPATKVKGAAKPAVKSVVKAAAKTANKTTPKTAPQAATAKAAVTKAPVVKAAAAKKPVSAKPAIAKTVKVPKEKKIKMVRDSISIPKSEYEVLDAMKLRAGKLGVAMKKTELIRAGIKALAELGNPAFLSALAAIPSLKTGRPPKAA